MGTPVSATCSLQHIESDILTLGVVCLTGGYDLTNTPLLTFPASAHPHLQCWTSARLGNLLRHYVTWLAVTSQARSVACLSDLRNASKEVITVLVEAVERLELNSRGTVSSVYFLKPTNKARSKLLKKLLGLKPSRKHPKIPLFKIVLMKTHQELFNQIDLCHLTSEFGGTLTYDHAAWMKFHDTVAPCLREAETLRRRLPGLKDRVELLQDYDIHTHSVAGIQQLLQHLTQSFQHTLSEARFQETLELLKQTLLILDNRTETETNPNTETEARAQSRSVPDLRSGLDPGAGGSGSSSISSELRSRCPLPLLRRVHGMHVREAAGCVRELYTWLEGQRVEVESTWREVEEGLTVRLHIQRHRERAAEIEKRMKTHYGPLLQEHPSIGSTLSQAELYRTHFTTTLYEPSKELLSQATEILEDVQRLRERLSHVSTGSDHSDVTTDILGRLTVALQPFTHKLQTLQDVYVNVHIFHLLFQKALTWYRKALKFLPEGLESQAAETGRGREEDDDDDDERVSATDAAVFAVEDDTSPLPPSHPATTPTTTTTKTTTSTTTISSSSSSSSSGRSSSKILQMPVEWQMMVQSFLHKHPPPREEHLARLDIEIPPQVEKGLRVQARSLALRLRLLQRVLYSRRMSAKLLSTIFQWRAEVLLNHGSSNSSTPQPKSPRHVVHRDGEFPQTPTGGGGVGPQRQGLPGVPPPKPARLFHAMRYASSFSSSEAGDTDNAPINLLEQTGERLASSALRDEHAANVIRDTSPSRLRAKYHKPPKVDIKFGSHGRESHGKKSECSAESKASEELLRGSERSDGEHPTSEDERFIRLTFTPPACHTSQRSGSLDSEDTAFRFADAQTGSESGIEVVEAEDPWDSLIDQIKAVSKSNLPSDVKIQCMSHLLSQTAMADSTKRQREASSYSSNLSLPQQRRGEESLTTRKDVAGFDQFSKSITLPQDSDLRRYQSFAIAREDVLRAQHRGRQDSIQSSSSTREFYTPRGTATDRRRPPTAGLQPSDPLRPKEAERPASAVARMRHRLARSLMDLDEIEHPHSGAEDVLYSKVRFQNLVNSDHRRKAAAPSHPAQFDSTGGEFASAARAPRTVRFSRTPRHPLQHQEQFALPPSHSGRKRATESLSKSYEGGLDSLHFPEEKSSKLVAWRSHEDGLDSLERPSFLSEKPSFIGKGAAAAASSESGSSGICSTTKRCSAPLQLRATSTTAAASAGGGDAAVSSSSSSSAARKNPYRWRQGIIEEFQPLPSPVKERRKSQDFLAPSFLKPFHSMHNLHALEDSADPSRRAPLSLTFVPGAAGRFQERVHSNSRGDRGGGGGGKAGGRSYWNGLPRETESDSLSESGGSRRYGEGRKSSLERLSDEVDQEYLSQDEVHSSLQRSQRILMEAEDSLRVRATRRQRDATRKYDPPETDDTLTPVVVRSRIPTLPPADQQQHAIRHYSAAEESPHWNEAEAALALAYKPIQIRIDSVEDGTVNGTGACTDTSASVSPDQEEAVTSDSKMADGGFDADVSNMSDSNTMDCDNKKHESEA